MDDEELTAIPKEQFDMLVLKANIELLQRVNRLITVLEENIVGKTYKD